MSVSVRSVALKRAHKKAAAFALQQVQASPKTAVAALARRGTKHWAARLNAGSLLASDAPREEQMRPLVDGGIT